MKIALCSDLHLEHGNILFDNTEGAKVLILAGDITTARGFATEVLTVQKNRFLTFFEHISRQFEHVVYVLGNHEHYGMDFLQTKKIIESALQEFKNVRVLEKQVFTVDDVTFIGGTLWTDCNKQNPLSMMIIQNGMCDFTIIENGERTLQATVLDYEAMGVSQEKYHSTRILGMDPELDRKCAAPIYKTIHLPDRFKVEDSVTQHYRTLSYIREVTAEQHDRKFVVISHHAPSEQSCHPRYAGDGLNAAYYSDLFTFVEDRPQIKAWVHGHTHTEFDYQLAETRVLCHPRGYAGYEVHRDAPFTPKYIDV